VLKAFSKHPFGQDRTNIIWEITSQHPRFLCICLFALKNEYCQVSAWSDNVWRDGTQVNNRAIISECVLSDRKFHTILKTKSDIIFYIVRTSQKSIIRSLKVKLKRWEQTCSFDKYYLCHSIVHRLSAEDCYLYTWLYVSTMFASFTRLMQLMDTQMPPPTTLRDEKTNNLVVMDYDLYVFFITTEH
jgi:hypothetical protein